MTGNNSKNDNVDGNANENQVKVLKRKARIAGVFYLGVIVFGILAQVIRMNLIVSGDVDATAENIMDSEFLYRISFISDILMITSFTLLPLAFYRIFSKENKNLASLVVVFVLISVPVMLVNMVMHLAPLILLDGGDHLSIFTMDQVNSVVMVILDIREMSVMVATIFHGLWLLPLGLLVLKSKRFPKVFGILLTLACIGFLWETIIFFLVPSAPEILVTPGYLLEIVGEFGFCGYLLIKGVRKTG